MKKDIGFTSKVVEGRPTVFAVSNFESKAIVQFHSIETSNERYHAGLQLNGEKDCDLEVVSEGLATLLEEAESADILSEDFYYKVMEAYKPFFRNETAYSAIQGVRDSIKPSWD